MLPVTYVVRPWPSRSFRALAFAALLLPAGSLFGSGLPLEKARFEHAQIPIRSGWRAVSVASADLDGDGSIELLIGEVGERGYRLRSWRGALAEGCFPVAARAAGQAGEDLGTEAIPVPPDFLRVADLDADGVSDVVLAERGGKRLWWLAGRGGGRLGEPRAVHLPGRLEFLEVADVDRPDGFADLLAVTGHPERRGSLLSIWSSMAGAASATPEAIPFASRIVGLDAGRLGEPPVIDLAVVTETEAWWLIGRQGRRGREPGARAMRSFELPDSAIDVTVGRFAGGHGVEMAVLLAGGGVSVLDPATGTELRRLASSPAVSRLGAGPGGSLLAGGEGGLELVARDAPAARLLDDAAYWLRLRTTPDPFDDLVVVRASGAVEIVRSRSLATFPVNTTGDGSDHDTGDGVCDSDPDPGSTLCSLRAAIEQANASAGPDTISFAVGGGGAQVIMVGLNELVVTEAVTIDGTTQPGYAGEPLIELAHSGGAFTGLVLQGDDVTVCGLSVTGFAAGEAISISGDRAVVEGNWLGMRTDGVADPNGKGVASGGADARIGGLAFGAENLISGNLFGGVALGPAATNNVLLGNLIGPDRSGFVAIGNGIAAPGVKIDGPMNVVGGTALDASNLISGNDNPGVWLAADGNRVQSNRIGTDGTGLGALANGFAGIFVEDGADLQTIGGTVSVGNLISGNGENSLGQGGAGIEMQASIGSFIDGNNIGTSWFGGPLGNLTHGIHIAKVSTTVPSGIVIGGLGDPLNPFGNLISDNGRGGLGHGIFIEGGDEISIWGNLIGSNGAGDTPLPNSGDGIRLEESSRVIIGDPPVLDVGPNLIAWNGGSGVSIHDLHSTPGLQNSHGNRVTYNSIFDNGLLGIDLTLGSAIADGPTANDPGDADFGPNRLQNTPVITGVATAAGTTTIDGSLSSLGSTPYRIQLFTSDQADPSGFGEGQDLLGEVDVTTLGDGSASFQFQTTDPVAFVSATATDLTREDTSEFSAPFDPGGLLGDRVWSDEDGNGLQGQEEPGVAGVTVRLLSAAGVELDSTVTGPEGWYRFDDLVSGTYKLEVVPPAGAAFTLQDQGTEDSTDSDVDPTTGRTDVFAYTANDVDLSRDAGLVLPIFADGFESGDTSAWSSTM